MRWKLIIFSRWRFDPITFIFTVWNYSRLSLFLIITCWINLIVIELISSLEATPIIIAHILYLLILLFISKDFLHDFILLFIWNHRGFITSNPICSNPSLLLFWWYGLLISCCLVETISSFLYSLFKTLLLKKLRTGWKSRFF